MDIDLEVCRDRSGTTGAPRLFLHQGRQLIRVRSQIPFPYLIVPVITAPGPV
jgi:hypothetical protein